ncbi:MAG: hypothetical protein AAGN46_02160 [Acidobacteriota bacterium]
MLRPFIRPASPCVVLLFALFTAWARPAPAQLTVETVDGRSPLELNSATLIDHDLLLIGALYSDPNQISVFRGPALGLGPWVEEVVISTGDPYFALSRDIVCRDSVCHFTAVNGTTSNVELFSRSTQGVWSRQVVTTAGVYFNSDLGLNAGAITFIAYDAFALEIEVWRSTGGGPFVQIGTHGPAAGAIFGALRASLATDAEGDDYAVVFDDAASLPTTLWTDRPIDRLHYPSPPLPLPFLRGTSYTRMEGILDGRAIDDMLDPIDEQASGQPADLREAAFEYECDVLLFVFEDDDGRFKLVVRFPTGGLIGMPANLGPVDEGDTVQSISIDKAGARGPGRITYYVAFASGALALVEIDSLASRGPLGATVTINTTELTPPPLPGALAITSTSIDGVKLVAGVGSLVAYRVLEAQADPTAVFLDSFETGDTGAWSSTSN